MENSTFRLVATTNAMATSNPATIQQNDWLNCQSIQKDDLQNSKVYAFTDIEGNTIIGRVQLIDDLIYLSCDNPEYSTEVFDTETFFSIFKDVAVVTSFERMI